MNAQPNAECKPEQKRASGLWLTALAICYVIIWWQDSLWLTAPADTLPLVSGLILLLFLGRPWIFLKTRKSISQPFCIIAIALIAFGIAINIMILSALGWTLLLTVFLRSYFQLPRYWAQLLPLAFFAFPWVATDLPMVGWWFRISAATVSAWIFQSLGFLVMRQGADIQVQGLPISVEAACSGLNLLQALLLAGAVLGLLQLRGRTSYWGFLLSLPLLAWFANTCRILVITAVALSSDTTFAAGLFHTWGGLLVVVLMFGAAQFLVTFLSKTGPKEVGT
ncbi:archaeosortase/exosortase family protein [Rubellicoccus peritrichatus]|uniref:Archaeosortase/exosortase family protein n=1 Tax=Rubellicoccus peritrichatus TaxID=3080537 RepID=A0AAQ3QS51_9BACT|nr:archaeosortase/exosortase family protein [Puniceicoccus sp. CR14]WOO42023.1 archaeosortase/exosortase family protein [Puniceicoccus sp. CR14]